MLASEYWNPALRRFRTRREPFVAAQCTGSSNPVIVTDLGCTVPCGNGASPRIILFYCYFPNRHVFLGILVVQGQFIS